MTTAPTAQPSDHHQAGTPMTPTTTAVRPVRVRRRGELMLPARLVSHGVLIVASVIAIFPVLYIAYISLGTGDLDYLHPGAILGKASLANYTEVLNKTDFLIWFRNSTIVALGTCAFGVLASASTGYAVSRMRFLGRGQLLWMLLVTQMFPIAILIVPMYEILSNLQLLDGFLGLILVYATTIVPYCAWLLKGYFDTIPTEIDEAGRVDGLTPFGTFWRLILPLARPGLAVAAFYSFVTAWSEVAYASTFMLSSGNYTLAVGLQTFISEHDQSWQLMATTAVLIAVPASLAFYLVQRHLVTGLTAGAAKS